MASVKAGRFLGADFSATLRYARHVTSTDAPFRRGSYLKRNIERRRGGRREERVEKK